MANIKFNASKKTTIILLVVLFFVIGGSGGYLLWRVNQSKTVAPTDSSAGAGCCCNQKCKDGYPAWDWCTCGCKPTDDCAPTSNCEEPCDRPPSVECMQGQDCNEKVHCCWPEVAYCNISNNTCECKLPPNNCTDVDPQCTPTCPSGYVKCSGAECVGDVVNVECAHNCRSCNNRYYVCEKCMKKQEEPPQPQCGDREVNQDNEECDPPGSTCTKNGKQGVCDDKCKCPVVADPPRIEKCDGVGKGTAISFIPSTVKKGATINYKYTMGDSKGLDVNSVSVLLNHSTLDVEKNVSPSSGTPTKATVSGKLDTSTVGKHNVMIAWKRPGETSFSEACQIRGNFTVEDVGTPKWDIAKTASEECVVDSDGESIAKLTYSITIKNNGNATGTITNVTDKLDSKVVDGSVTDISDGGTYSSSDRSIKWGQFDIPAGQTKTLTYSFTVRKDAFGVYDNVVIVKPSDGTDYIANASITADCVEDPYVPPTEGGKVPDTGLFDESENLVIMGGILLFLGLGWTWLNRTYQIVNGKLVQRSKERFEQRVVKN